VEEHPAYGYSSEEQEEAPSGDGRTLAMLRSLLLGPEQQNIRALRERLENRELRTEDVSAVVAEAIRLRHTCGGSEILIEALTPSVIGALRKSARKDPRTLSEVFFPVVGPAIRRSLTQYIQSLLESFNNALEHSLSLQGLRWRLEAHLVGGNISIRSSPSTGTRIEVTAPWARRLEGDRLEDGRSESAAI
jgi:hypothetical protein